VVEKMETTEKHGNHHFYDKLKAKFVFKVLGLKDGIILLSH